MFNYNDDVEKLQDARKNLIFVSWNDHYSGEHPWTSIESIIIDHKNDNHVECQTCGFLIYEDDEFIKVALSINANAESASVFSILKSTIVKRVDFEV